MIDKWEPIATQWQKFSVDAKKKWKQLTDEELAQVSGSRNTLAMIIQRRYFVTKKDAHDQIEMWMGKLKV